MRCVFAVVVVLALVSACSAQWTSCGGASAEMTITSISVPVPPVQGQSFTITVDGTLHTEIKAGTVSGKTLYEGVVLGSSSSDLCSSMKNTTQPCPWKPGPLSFYSKSTMPTGLPSGQYTEQLTIQDNDTNQLVFCIQGIFNL